MSKNYRKKQIDLLPDAGMDVYQLNTSVVKSVETETPGGIDGNLGIRIWASGGWNSSYGDHVTIRFMHERDARPGAPWYFGHFSVARARILAYEILARCDQIEKEKY